jgi:hypothetical protein
MTALFLFKSTHDVIKAERLCISNTIPCKVIPVPRDISSECGMAIQIDNKESAVQAGNIFKDAEIEAVVLDRPFNS